MKSISFLLFFVAAVIVIANCNKDTQRVNVEFREKPISASRYSSQQGFNGAVSHYTLGNVYSFQTTVNKRSGDDCETFGDYAVIQAGSKKAGGQPGFFLDYYTGRNVLRIGDGTAVMFKTNTFRWYFHHDEIRDSSTVHRWRISINEDDIAEFDVMKNYDDAYVGFGMCQTGTFKTTTWQPAFLFNGAPTDNISPFWQQVGSIDISVPLNRVVGSK